MYILVLNAGSSSLKSSLYRLTAKDLPLDPIMPIWTGQIDWKADQKAILRAKTATGRSVQVARSNTTRSADIQDLLNCLWQGETQVIEDIKSIDIVGHRVVHGGTKYHQPILIDEQVQAEIDRLAILAPLHNPANLMGIKVMDSMLATLPQVAVFDTAFYGDLPDTAYVYPLPYQWLDQGIRKYGFHGISHQYCAQRAAQLLGQDLPELRLISCHLGNGCSLAAIKNGRCIDTTMGFTPLDGLMMGTRCGSIDPGIILHLLRQGDYTVEALDHALNFESGLLGVSGISNDLREIDRAISAGNARAKLAIDLYVHILAAKIASLLPELGGVDALIFTAGVGENHAGIRAAVAAKLAFIGVELDSDLNCLPISSDLRGAALSDREISTSQSLVKLLVIYTQEEWQIARICWQYLRSS
jgi:acetate kinase